MTITALDELTTRVRAPNPSPMTLDGTNTYLLGPPGAGQLVVVDPGPGIGSHRATIERVSGGGSGIAGVVVTHHHADHAESATAWARAWRVPLYAFDPVRVEQARRLGDGRRMRLAGITLEAVHTPGHSSDHLCLRVDDTGIVLSGDHVLGRGTAVIAWPDGDLVAYLASLRRLQRLMPTALYPGHGPVVADPNTTIEHYIAHREEREQQVLQALVDGAATTSDIVRRVYGDMEHALHAAAERSVRAQLAKLAAEGRLVRPGEEWGVGAGEAG